MNNENTRANYAKNQRKTHAQDEEDCKDRVCSDTKNEIKSWMKQSVRPNQPDCPLDRKSLGRNTWSLLHTMAAKYPVRPSSEDKENMKEFIRLMSILYPCSHCAQDFRRDIKESPPQLESRNALAFWFCDIHNKVNKKLNKPIFDCSKVDERWRTGPKDGSCF